MIFPELPLNTKKVYTAITTPNGCVVYIPVDTFEREVVLQTRDSYQKFLDSLQKEDNGITRV